nr:PH-interacting protein-like [Salvelinus alpinus]
MLKQNGTAEYWKQNGDRRVRNRTGPRECKQNGNRRGRGVGLQQLQRGGGVRRGRPLDPQAWRGRSKELIDLLFQCEDSEPFRQPVDLEQYPDYLDICGHPMDFRTVRAMLRSGEYTTPLELCQTYGLSYAL